MKQIRFLEYLTEMVPERFSSAMIASQVSGVREGPIRSSMVSILQNILPQYFHMLGASFLLSMLLSHPVLGQRTEEEPRHPMSGSMIAGTTTPGSILYPQGGMGILNHWLMLNEVEPSTIVADLSQDSALVAFRSVPSEILKVSVMPWDEPMVRREAILLAPGENNVSCGVYDPITQCALFGTDTTPARIVKVSMGSGDKGVRIGAITLLTGENRLRCAAIDPSGEYAWFGTLTTPGRVIKVRIGEATAPPERLGAVTLNTGENNLTSAIRLNGEHLLFVGETTPGRIVKVAAGVGDAAPTRVSALTLNAGETPGPAVLDPVAGQVLVAATANIIKVDPAASTSAPVRLNSTTLVPGGVKDASYDAGSGATLWAGTAGVLWKLRTRTPAEAPLLISDLVMSWDSTVNCLKIVPLGGDRAYVLNTGKSTKILIGGPEFAMNLAADMPHVVSGGTNWETGVYNPETAMLILAAGDGFGFGWSTNRVHFGEANMPPVLDYGDSFDAVRSPGSTGFVLDQEANQVWSGARPPCCFFEYFTGEVFRFDAGDLDTLPGEDESLGVNGSHGYTIMHAVDSADDYGLAWGSFQDVGFPYGSSNPSTLYQFSLGKMAAAGTPLSQVGKGLIQSMYLETVNDYAYLGSFSGSIGRLEKWKIQPGTGGINLASQLSFAPDLGTPEHLEGDISRSVVLAFSVPYQAPGVPKVVSVSMSADAVAPVKLSECVLDATADEPTGLKVDAESAVAWVTVSNPPKVYKFQYGSGATPIIKLGEMPLSESTFDYEIPFFDVERSWGCAVLGSSLSGSQPTAFMDQYALSTRGYLKASRCELSDKAEINDFHFYSHTAKGKLRLTVYDNSSPRRRLWYSAWVTNNAEGSELVIPVEQGAPTKLTLNAGTYWLGWESDTHAHVASYVAGVAGDGFTVAVADMLSPIEIMDTEVEMTSELWTQYVTYEIAANRVADWNEYE